jgi:hypothetical protein
MKRVLKIILLSPNLAKCSYALMGDHHLSDITNLRDKKHWTCPDYQARTDLELVLSHVPT